MIFSVIQDINTRKGRCCWEIENFVGYQIWK